jgi:hypothetical protein
MTSCYRLLASAVLLSAALTPASGFAVYPRTRTTIHRSLALPAKKKKGGQAGKGFAKSEPTPAPKPSTIDNPPPAVPDTSASSQQQAFLQSVDGGSDSLPKMDPELPPEERAKKVLREQYGLRTMEEQQMEDNIKAQRKKLEDWKRLAEKEEDIDIMKILPAPVLKAIDTFLKLGVAVCTVLFVAAGLGITAEAWSKTSGNPLPDNIDNFIVNTVEPNFTIGLFVLLGFSVSLGAFAALQLASASSTYREE